MVCFFCATPYHVMLAMIMKMTCFKKEAADLVLYNHFKDSYTLYKRIKKTNLFTGVFFINENNYTLTNRIKRLFHIICPGSVIKKIAGECVYREIVFFSIDFLNMSFIIKEYHKRNFNCIFSYGEDGIGTYMDSGVYCPSPKVAFLLKKTGRLKWLDEIHNIYVLEPRLLQYNYKKQMHVIPLPSETEFRRYLDILWPGGKEKKIRKIVYLQEPFQEDLKPKKGIEEDRILELCQAIFGESDFTVKLHPRTRKYHINSKIILDTSIPFECLLTSDTLDNKIIISIMSTAAITPGLLYEKKPYIIFLYKLFPEIQFDSKIQDFIDCLGQFSVYSGKVLVPENIDELKLILKSLKEELDGR